MSRDQALAKAFVELADTLVQDFDLVDFMYRLTRHCVALLDVDSAGVMLDDQRGGMGVVAASDEHVHFLELMELQRGEGPCLDAFRSRESVQASSAEAQQRWPGFAPHAQAQGYAILAAIPLRLREEAIGALNVFRRSPQPFDSQELSTAQALADVATIGLLHERDYRAAAQLAEHLQRALDGRVVVEQAKGVLGAQAGLGMTEAFDAMRRYARNNNLRLAGVAARIVSGDLHASRVVSWQP